MSGTELDASGRLADARDPPASGARSPAAFGTSPAALARHYDLPAEFFALWLGPELVYSCARWEPDDPEDTLERAQHRKVDHFATALERARRSRARRRLRVGRHGRPAVTRSTARRPSSV